MKYERFKKLPKKQKITMILFWASITLATIGFYTYLAGEIICKILK